MKLAHEQNVEEEITCGFLPGVSAGADMVTIVGTVSGKFGGGCQIEHRNPVN